MAVFCYTNEYHHRIIPKKETMMQTVSISIENLCVPCHASCRHCLLCAGGPADGVEAERGMQFAARFLTRLQADRPDLHGSFYMGCCNDFPQLRAYVRFLRQYSPMIDVLQCNGFAFHPDEEIDDIMRMLRDEGMRGIDLTFYGSEQAHDAFARRQSDYAHLMQLLRSAHVHGLRVHVGVPLLKGNADSLPALFDALAPHSVEQYFTFLPHAKGRGWQLEGDRLTMEDFLALCEPAKAHFSHVPHKTEAEWLRAGGFPVMTRRHLTLALTQQSIDRLENTPPDRIISELEAMDDAYYDALPPTQELAAACGRPDNRQLFRFRDLYLVWQKRWWQTHPLTVRDMNDERGCFSVRMADTVI